jgi:dihydrolipoamide dehydrogenase
MIKEYDVIIIGSGSGMSIVNEALNHDLHVALVDNGPLGGTCLNAGCIPSKMLIVPADRIVEIQEANKLGIDANIKNINFKSIMERMRRLVREDQGQIGAGITSSENLDLYQEEGHFASDYILQVGNNTIKGKKIAIVSGSRPVIPPIKGLDSTDYLTSETILDLNEPPESMVIIGGGYVAVEYGHFLAAMGTNVTIVEMADRLVLSEEAEISALLKQELSQRMTIYTNTQAEEVKSEDGSIAVLVRDSANGGQNKISAHSIMIATGRKSNADLLKVESTGVALDSRGFIKVNQYLETTKKNIWAAGDAIGKHMFTHVSNREAIIVSDNMMHDIKLKMDYSAIPHAIYSHPQIAAVGLIEQAAREKHSILVGRARYFDVAKGVAMTEDKGFAKAIVNRKNGKLLGFHIIGPYAPILIQEVINVMAGKNDLNSLNTGLHIHPALPELILSTLGNLEEA